jgi:hypothetical protein
MLKSLKEHSHKERQQIAETLLPLIQRHVGDQLVALAVTGSFARNTDAAYSDIELIAFVKERPEPGRHAVVFIYDGMLVDIWILTRKDYVAHHKGGDRKHWPHAATSTLTPLLNAAFIQELSAIPSPISLQDRVAALKDLWPEVQEASGKLLTAIDRTDTLPIPFLYWTMVEKLCVALSYVNARPFTTRAAIFAETMSFDRLPASFRAVLEGPSSSPNLPLLSAKVRTVFLEVEEILENLGVVLCQENLSDFVNPLVGGKLRRRLANNRVIRKLLGNRVAVN